MSNKSAVCGEKLKIMIFTFLEINKSKKVIFFAKDKEEAFIEMKVRYGKEAINYSLISYVDVKDFNLILN